MTHKPTIAILGGGVSGLTSGVILNLAGYDTRIYAEHLPTWTAYERNLPQFATLYAAASVLPHAVDIQDPIGHLNRSHAFFRKLAAWPEFCVRQQPHYEVFEQPDRAVPRYARAMENLTAITTTNARIIRNPSIPVNGWCYSGFVVDMPIYMRWLLRFYRETGGTIVQHHLSRADFLDRPEDLVINCGGLEGSKLVNDEAPYEITRGHLVYVDVPNSVSPEPPFPFSYNYMPTTDVYAQPDGRPADVYFYPRPDRWVLGGSRQRVQLGAEDAGLDPEDPSTVEIDGIEVPEPVVRLNRRLLLRSTGVDITEYPMESAFGYRFERHPVRLETSVDNGRSIIHNYGHGGAGLTLSWSCAVDVLELVEQEISRA